MYVLDNAAPQAVTRLSALADMFDPGTIRHLEARGIHEGWHCLEIGAGSGSIARWLAGRVGVTGRVLATDIDPRHLESSRAPNIEIRRHDVATDPLPVAAFDLIHARLVLNAIPHDAQLLPRLVAALKPGGWLVSEDFESYAGSSEAADGVQSRALKSTRILREVLAAKGLDSHYGRGAGVRFRGAGLQDVDMEGRVYLWRGGNAGVALTRANREQLRGAMLATGLITQPELDEEMALLDRPDFETTSPILWTAWGRRAP